MTGFLLTNFVIWATVSAFTFGIFFDQFRLEYSSWPGLGSGLRLDKDGIPTVIDGNWIRLIEKQGFIHASERLWQMELTRRSSEGHLSDWFGDKAFSHDSRRAAENWGEIADRGVQILSPNEKQVCLAYTRGINRFIENFPTRKGIEYYILGQNPKKWHCRDSLLVAMALTDNLTSSADNELSRSIWREALPDAWFKFLFPTTSFLIERNFADASLKSKFKDESPPLYPPKPLNLTTSMMYKHNLFTAREVTHGPISVLRQDH